MHVNYNLKDAIKELNCLQSNADVIEKLRNKQGCFQQSSLPETQAFLLRMSVKVRI